MDDAKGQKERSTRFSTISNFFPAPERELDCLIYLRIIMDYTKIKKDTIDDGLKQHFVSSRHKKDMLSISKVFRTRHTLDKKYFRYFCQVGCPQATH